MLDGRKRAVVVIDPGTIDYEVASEAAPRVVCRYRGAGPAA